MKTMGLDLSLTGTGWAVVVAGEEERQNRVADFGWFSAKDSKVPMQKRLNYLYGAIMAEVAEAKPSLVAIEACSKGNFRSGKTGGAEERIGLQWLIRCALDRLGIDCIMVEPSSLKLAWAGSGKAEKADMIEACRRWYHFAPATDDEADAVALAWVAAQVQGAIPVTYSALELVHRLKSGGI